MSDVNSADPYIISRLIGFSATHMYTKWPSHFSNPITLNFRGNGNLWNFDTFYDMSVIPSFVSYGLSFLFLAWHTNRRTFSARYRQWSFNEKKKHLSMPTLIRQTRMPRCPCAKGDAIVCTTPFKEYALTQKLRRNRRKQNTSVAQSTPRACEWGTLFHAAPGQKK